MAVLPYFFELQKRIDLTFADDYHKRVFGFISEFLLYVWVTARGLRAFECRVAIIGEKMETREVKDKMALFFRKRRSRCESVFCGMFESKTGCINGSVGYYGGV